jgi:hypothetical protein
MSDAINFDHLVELCRLTHEEMQKRAVRAVDLTLVVRNWLFGRYIVEYEQHGADRAAYGAGLMDALTSRLKPFGIKGVSATRLRLYRSFYREYEAIQPTPSGELAKSALSSGIQPTPSVELAPTHQTAAELIKSVENLIRRFSLGWSHYFDRHVKLPDELPTIGIVLCHRKNDALVELTLPPDANIFASKYQLYLPSKEELKARLEQITHDLEGGEAL